MLCHDFDPRYAFVSSKVRIADDHPAWPAAYVHCVLENARKIQAFAYLATTESSCNSLDGLNWRRATVVAREPERTGEFFF